MSSIRCPKCRAEFDVSEVVSSEVSAKLESEKTKIAEEASRKLRAAEDAIRERWEAEVNLERERAEREILEAKSMLEERVAAAKRRAEESAAAEAEAAVTELAEARRKLAEASSRELELRKTQRSLEDRQRDLELEVARKLDAEREAIRAEASRRADELHAAKQAEWDKTKADLLRQTEELRRKAEQGSQQTQGESLELALEESLRSAFRTDEVEPVAKGVRGADALQRVRDASGRDCGSILWECKRTKTWSDGWVPKLKDDTREARASAAVIVTTALPRGVTGISQVDGVWVCTPSEAVGLSAALRAGLVEVERVRGSQTGKSEKTALLYEYFSSPEFRSRVEAVAESLVAMREDLDAEKRAFEKIWAKREKQILRAASGVNGLGGDVAGITGERGVPELEMVAETRP